MLTVCAVDVADTDRAAGSFPTYLALGNREC